MNTDSVMSFFGWLLAHAPEVAIWSTIVVAALVLLIVFGRQAREWRNPSTSPADTAATEAEDITPPSVDYL